MIKKGLSGLWTLGIIGALVIIISMFPLAMSGNTYNALPWVWIVLLSIGIVLISYPVLKGAKSL